MEKLFCPFELAVKLKENGFKEPCLAQYEDEEETGYRDCPACGKEYDEIDFEYQICHYCKFNANQSVNK